MPVIQCDIRAGRSEEQKAALAQAVTRAVHETIDAPLDYIYVIVREQPASDHVKGGEPLPEYATP